MELLNKYFKDDCFKVFANGQLSWGLIPLAFLFLYNRKYIEYFSYIFVYISLIGIIDTVVLLNSTKCYLFAIFSVLFHLLLSLPLLNFDKNFKPNSIHLFFLLLAHYIINNLYYWPYSLNRDTFVFVLYIIHIILLLSYRYRTKNFFQNILKVN